MLYSSSHVKFMFNDFFGALLLIYAALKSCYSPDFVWITSENECSYFLLGCSPLTKYPPRNDWQFEVMRKLMSAKVVQAKAQAEPCEVLPWCQVAFCWI